MQAQIEEIALLRAQTRNWRLGMVVGILAIVVTCVLLIVNSVSALAKPGPTQDILLKELKSGVEDQVIPPVKQIAQRTMTDLQKELKKEVDKATERAPEIMEAFNKELEALKVNVPQRGSNVLAKTFGSEFKRREAKLQKMFPGVTEDKVSTLVDNIVKESEASVDHLSQVLFGQHIKALNDIFTHIETIQKTEKVDPKEEATSWEIALTVFDVLREELQVFDRSSTNATPTASDSKTNKAQPARKEAK